MEIKDLFEDIKEKRTVDIERDLNKLVRENYRYRNLNSDNRELVMDIIKKYLKYFKRGIGLNYSMVRTEMNKLYKNRLKNDLTEEDLDDIRDILEEFRA
jgi:DNA repair exonuclease SbcCD nuclease subunit